MGRIFKRTKEGQAYLDRYDCDGCSSKISVDGGTNSLPEEWYDDEHRDELYCKICFEELYVTCGSCGIIDKLKYFAFDLSGKECISCYAEKRV